MRQLRPKLWPCGLQSYADQELRCPAAQRGDLALSRPWFDGTRYLVTQLHDGQLWRLVEVYRLDKGGWGETEFPRDPTIYAWERFKPKQERPEA